MHDGKDYWLWNGFHRTESAEKAGIKEIQVNVQQGHLIDAQWLSFGANKDHGLRRSNEEKQAAVKSALLHEMGNGKSNRAIAEHCGVDEGTVRKIRAELESVAELPQQNTRISKDGKTYNASKPRAANIPSATKKPSPDKKMGQRVRQLLATEHPLTTQQIYDALSLHYAAIRLGVRL